MATAMNSSEAAALRAIDLAHGQDPKQRDGRALELIYAERLEAWMRRLCTEPSAALVISARAQHLERWVIARSQFPMDRPGYHRWRKAVQLRQGQRVHELLTASGCHADLAERVRILVSKTANRGDRDAQILEDAACLVFLGSELAEFVAEHPDYTAEHLVDILKKSWGKMSPQARTLAGTIPFPPAHAELIRQATAS
jgi:hypothetical protein